ncbi:MAG: Ig-like domain-containing protein [Lachnospiraceae bacterium]|nr:Ig-like domain-containing protein [Lachnospiraceae bacterium]
MKKSITIILFTLLLFVTCGVVNKTEAHAANPYMIKINKQQNVVTIYKYKGGKYKAYKAFVCSAGSATPLGTFHLQEKLRWHLLDGPSYGQYCTRIYKGFLFHSVWYHQQTKDSQSYIQYNRLGSIASHGCVRLTVADAKWIFDNCPTGTKVIIYKSKNPGPLGKPRAIKVSGYSGWDPTDPDPENPYRNKKPTIKGAKSKSIAYGSKFNVMKGIKVKNSTGFNAKDLLRTKIYYKMDKKTKYKKVKKIDTNKPGKYKVTYSITDEIKHKAKVTVVYKVLTKVSVSSITLNHRSKTLYLGGKASAAKFTLKVKKIKPKTATSKKVIYTSSNPSVATVSKKGVVRAQKAGTAVITVKAADGSGTVNSCTVTVRQYATGLSLTAAGKVLTVGNAMQLHATLKPSTVSNRSLTYRSSNPAVASVSSSGSVKALKSGTVTITATTKDGSNISASYTITVVYRYAKVTSAIREASVTTGTSWETVVAEKLPSSVTIADAYGNTAQATVTWSCAAYDESKPGSYEVTGTVTLPSGWIGTIPKLKATVQVTEEPEEQASE